MTFLLLNNVPKVFEHIYFAHMRALFMRMFERDRSLVCFLWLKVLVLAYCDTQFYFICS